MNKFEILLSIAKYLSRFQEEVEILNSSDDFSINKISEDILIYLLNQSLQLSLINANYSERRNYPAIDLIDYENKVGVQVTATPSTDKVKKTLEKFYTHKVYEKVENVYIYILTKKLNSYPAVTIQNFIDELNNKYKQTKKLSFEIETNILDRRDLYEHIKKIVDVEQLKLIELYLIKNFGELAASESLSKYYEDLKNQFYDVVFDDESGMTLKYIYEDPYFFIYEDQVREKGKFTNSSLSKFLSYNEPKKLNEFITAFITRNYSSGIQQSNLLIMLGYPGQGKTSSLKKFTNDYIIQKHEKKRDVFYFKLKEIRQGKLLAESPISVLLEEAKRLTDVEISPS
jgi:hypothetical protein